MIPLVVPGPGCAIQVEQLEVSATNGGWTEQTRIEVAGAPGCPWVDLTLPANAVMVAFEGRSRLGDGQSQKLGSERWERRTRDVQGVGAVRVHLPELIQGDQAVLTFTRQWTGGFEWQPALHGSRFVELEGTPDAQHGFQQDGEAFWAAPPGSDARARFGTVPMPPPLATADAPSASEILRLQIPPGNPQFTLYPGGGSSVRVEQTFTFAAHLDERAWVVPIGPLEGEPAWSCRPVGAARVERRDDSLRIVLAGSEAGANVSVAWTRPDAPTFGEGGPDLQVSVDGGEIAWEEVGQTRMWRLVEWADTRILPDRAAYIRALNRRFSGLNIPGVALPTELRGRTADALFAEDAYATLRARAGIGSWPSDPLWPRKLIRARRSLAYSEMEAALVLVGWLQQGGLDAAWALTRPFADGPGAAVSPAGFVHPLVVVQLAEGAAWMDPGCAECGPWEIRTAVAGTAIGPSGEDPPIPTGRWEVSERDGAVDWRLEGAAALALRDWLVQVAPAEREARLAQRIAGSSTIVSVTGVAEAGGPITARAVGLPGDDALRDDLGWVGSRIVQRPSTDQPDREWATPALRWQRQTVAGVTTETLEVRTVPVPQTAWQELAEQREAQAPNRLEGVVPANPVEMPAVVIP